MMQDIDPMPWGALDRFQVHFIVKKEIPGSRVADYVAKTKLCTTGRFGAKKVVSVSWIGGGISSSSSSSGKNDSSSDDNGSLASKLNGDTALNEMIAQQLVDKASIVVDPTDNAIRIYSKWQNSHDLGISKQMFEIYDKIAAHIKSI